MAVPVVMIVMMMVLVIIVVVMVVIAVATVALMSMRMIVVMAALRLFPVARLDARFAFSASANPAHQSTSSSLIRNSSPPVTCT